MPPPREAIVPAAWADFYEETHTPAAVRVGNTLRVTGHTGETADGVFSDDAEEQIRQVFVIRSLLLKSNRTRVTSLRSTRTTLAS